jgi:succinyl-CoA synthetase beta subunit
VGVNVPVVARLQGTKVTEGKKLLDDSGLKIISADDLTDAANKVVSASKGGN